MKMSMLLSAAGMAALCLATTVHGSSRLTNVNATAGSYYDDRFWPAHLLDDSSSSFWMSPPTTEERKFLYFNLNGLYALDRIETWNAAAWGDVPPRQLSSAWIEYSVDGINWTALGGVRQSFSTWYSDPGWDSFSFNGAQARLLRFGSYTNSGATDGWAAFGEVKFYGSEVSQSLQRIDGATITVTASGNYGDRYPGKTVDGSGLAADVDGDGVPTHDRQPANMWSSAAQSDVSNQWIKFEFAEPVSLDHMLVWNWNVPDSGGYDWCLRKARIRYSLNGTDWTTLADPALFTPGPGKGNNHDPGTEYYEATDQWGFDGQQVKYVMIDQMYNYKPNNDTHVGLSEVWFYTRPQGSTAPTGTVVLVQ